MRAETFLEESLDNEPVQKLGSAEAFLAAPDPEPVTSSSESTPSMNMARGAVERSGQLLGGLFTAGNAMAEQAEQEYPLGGLVWESGLIPDYKDPEEYQRWRAEQGGNEPLKAAADYWANFDAGYVENHTWDKLKKEFSEGGPLSASAWGEVLAYGAEQGVKSIPDMVAVMTAMPSYIMARSGEIGQTRAENKGKVEADIVDVMEAFPAALGSAIFERIGAGGITQAGAEVLGKEALKAGISNIGKEALKAGGKEALTEAVQEGIIEYLGEKLGTDAAMSVWEAIDRGAAGAVAGGVYGTAAGAGGAAVNQARNRDQAGDTEAEADQTQEAETSQDWTDTVLADEFLDSEPEIQAASEAPTGTERPAAEPDDNAPVNDYYGRPEWATEQTNIFRDGVQPAVTVNGQPDGALGLSVPDQGAAQPADESAPPHQKSAVGALNESGTGVFRVPVDRIKVDPEQYQFRTRVNEQGVDQRLSGVKKWDDRRAGSVLLHRRKDGSLYVADGHHRVDLAKRLGQPEINAQIIDEADGVGVSAARVDAAMNNIADNKAEPIDVAKVFRDSEVPTSEVRDTFNLPNSQVVRDGESLSKLSDNVFGMVTSGQLSEKDGAAIGGAFSEPGQQEAAADAFQKVQPDTEYQRQLLINEIRAAEFADAQGEQGGLFGDDPQEVSLMQDRLKVLDSLRQRLNSDKRLFKSLNDNADRATRAGNQIATEANESITQQSARTLDLISRVTTTPALNEMVNRAARRVYDGENRSKVVTELKQELMSYESGADASVGRPTGAPQGRKPASEPGQESRTGEPVSEPDTAGADQSRQPESQQGEVTPSLDLETQTEEQLAEQARVREEAQQAEARQKREEEQRATADEQVDSFTLTGSDRTADVAMAAGQDDMFVVSPTSERRAQQIASEMTVDEIKAEIDRISSIANKRMEKAIRQNGADAPSAGIHYLDDVEAERFAELKAALPSFAQERKEARERILKRAKERNLKRASKKTESRPSGDTPDSSREGDKYLLREESGVPYYRVREDQLALDFYSEPDNERSTSNVQSKRRGSAADTATINARRGPGNLSTLRHTRHVERQAVRYGVERVTGPQEAAHVLAPFRKDAQETMLALVLDAQQRPLAIIRNGKGTRNSAMVSPMDLVGDVLSVPNAASVWLSHNHPSGNMTPSQADVNLTQALRPLLNESGITLNGHIILSFGREAQAFGRNDSDASGTTETVTAKPRKMILPVLERVMGNRKPTDELLVQGSAEAKRALQNLADPDQTGLLLLDNKHAPVGFLDLTDYPINKLKGTDVFRQVIQAATRTNANAVIAQIGQKHSRDEGSNLGAMLSWLANKSNNDLRILDVMDVERGTYVSRAERRDDYYPSAWFSREGYRRTPGARAEALSAKEARTIAGELMRDWKGRPPVTIAERISEFPAGLQAAIREAGAEADMRAVFWNQQVYILAPRIPNRKALEEVILHEVVGHYGLRKLVGADLVPLLNRVYMDLGNTREAEKLKAVYFPGGFDPKNMEHRLVIAEELLAHLAESGKQRHRSLWQRIVAAVRDGLRRLGFTVRLNENDLLNILAGAQRTVEQNGFSRPDPSDMNFSRADHAHFNGTENAETVEILFHDSPEAGAFTVSDRVTTGLDFGGVFAGPDGGMYGEHRHAIVLNPDSILTVDDFESLDETSDEVKAAVRKAAPWMTDEQIEQAWPFIAETENVFDSDADVETLFKADDAGEASWEAQRIRGQVAKALGYQAVEMNDETGVSVLVLPGVTTYPIREGESTGDAEARIRQEWEEWKRQGAQSNQSRHVVPTDGAGDRTAAASVTDNDSQNDGEEGSQDVIPPGARFSRADVPDLDPEPFGAPSDTLLRKMISKVADKFTVLKGVQQNITDRFGEIEEDADAYLAEELFHGKVENDIRLIRENMIQPLAEKMSKYGVSLAQLDEFLYAKHAPERNRVIAQRNDQFPDGGSGMTNAEAAAVIDRVEKSGKLEQFQELADSVYRMLEHRRKILKDAGLLDEETLGAWEASYRHYVPLKGWAADEKQESTPKIGKGFAIAGKESQMAGGRKSKASSPVANAISDLSEAVLRQRKNEVGNAFLNLVQSYPNDGYWRVYTADNPEVERKAVKRVDPSTGKTVVRVEEQTVPMAMMSDRYFTTKVNGETYYIKLQDQRLMNAMRNIGPENNGLLVRSLSMVTRLMSSLNTSYNPEFVISNFSRDIQTALLNLTSEQSADDGKARGKKIAAKTLKAVPVAIRAINASLKGKALDGKAGEWQKHFDQFRADGAKTGWFDMKDVDGQMEDLETMISMASGGATNAARRAFRSVTDWVENTNSAIENGVRLSAYVNAIEAGIPRAKAASLAKNMTVNFNRKGELGTTMNALYMFANASVQGTANFVRTLGRLNGVKGDPVWRRLNTAQKIAAGMAVGGFMLSALNRLVAGDDDDGVNWWDKVPDYVKERNIVIMKSLVGGEPGEYWTIPLPYGYNIFPVIGTGMEHMLASDKPAGEIATNIVLAGLGSFSPIGFEQSEELYGLVAKNIMPTILRPVASISLNENFMGGPIFKENTPFGTPKPDSALYFRSTPEIFKALAKGLNEATGGSEFRSGAVDLSPDVMQFLIGYYGGGAYNFFTSRTPNYITKVVTGVQREWREVPFVRKVSGKVLPYDDLSKFYDRRDEINQILDERDNLRGRERIAFVKEYRDKIRLKGVMESVEKRLKLLRAQRDRVEVMDLSGAETDKRLQHIEKQMKRAIDQFNKRYNESVD